MTEVPPVTPCLREPQGAASPDGQSHLACKSEWHLHRSGQHAKESAPLVPAGGALVVMVGTSSRIVLERVPGALACSDPSEADRAAHVDARGYWWIARQGLRHDLRRDRQPETPPWRCLRVVRDAGPITLLLGWWRTDPPPLVHELLALTRESYAASRPGKGRA